MSIGSTFIEGSDGKLYKNPEIEIGTTFDVILDDGDIEGAFSIAPRENPGKVLANLLHQMNGCFAPLGRWQKRGGREKGRSWYCIDLKFVKPVPIEFIKKHDGVFEPGHSEEGYYLASAHVRDRMRR